MVAPLSAKDDSPRCGRKPLLNPHTLPPWVCCISLLRLPLVITPPRCRYSPAPRSSIPYLHRHVSPFRAYRRPPSRPPKALRIIVTLAFFSVVSCYPCCVTLSGIRSSTVYFLSPAPPLVESIPTSATHASPLYLRAPRSFNSTGPERAFRSYAMMIPPH